MIRYFLIIASLILSFNVFSQDLSLLDNIDNSRTRIVVLHPTAYNLGVIKLLIDKEMLKIDNLEILGVYFNKEYYNYSESREWIKNDSSNIFSLYELKGELELKDIFEENELSESFKKIFQNSKGIIFLGGDDIPSSVYSSKTNILSAPDDPYRNYFETSFLFHLIGKSGIKKEAFITTNPDYVCLGICLGMQTMNVANGGTLYQDIPTEIYNINYAEDILEIGNNNIHKNYNKWIDFGDSLSNGCLHKIKLKDNFSFNKIPNQVTVYSNHHQCIKELASDYYITANSLDEKVIEGIRHKQYKNVYGVQFHPETISMFDESLKLKFNSPETAYYFRDKAISIDNFDFHKQFWEEFSSLFK